MKVLKSLTFGVMSRGSQNPVLARRAKLVHRLEQQKRLAQDANFVVTVSRWLRNEAGSKELVQLQKRVRPWWREDVLGTVGLTVRYGAKAIEFEKGKTAIMVPSKDQLVATLDTVIAAVKAGELDEHLAHACQSSWSAQVKAGSLTELETHPRSVPQLRAKRTTSGTRMPPSQVVSLLATASSSWAGHGAGILLAPQPEPAPKSFAQPLIFSSGFVGRP